MSTISIELVDGDTYSVDIDHRLFAVTVDQADVDDLGSGDPVGLIRASFEFLLEREPVSSILPLFDLSVIERYFPEWRTEMRRRLR